MPGHSLLNKAFFYTRLKGTRQQNGMHAARTDTYVEHSGRAADAAYAINSTRRTVCCSPNNAYARYACDYASFGL
jgi:hypothetical protein